MIAGARVASFVAVLGLVFRAAALAGGAIEPRGSDPSARDDERGDDMSVAGDDEASGSAHAQEGAAHGGTAAKPVRGRRRRRPARRRRAAGPEATVTEARAKRRAGAALQALLELGPRRARGCVRVLV